MKVYEIIQEDTITPSDDPNIMSFWHGGDLSDTSMRPQKQGRFEYGAGLYLITRYDVAAKYAKGSRKLYMVNVRKGTDISKITLDKNVATDFINTFVIKSKRKEVLGMIDQYIERVGSIHANSFNNMILNSGAIKSADTVNLSKFLYQNGADYETISNPFGWGSATMLVLYNTDLIASVKRIMPKDKITQFDW